MALFVLIIWIPILAIFVGSLYFLISGLRRRNLGRSLAGLPFVVMLVGWFVLASSNPEPKASFEQAFLVSPPPSVTELKTKKPTFMDGHFLSFHISAKDFPSIVGEPFKSVSREEALRALRSASLPVDWRVEETEAFLRPWDPTGKNEYEVVLLWNPAKEHALATVWYPPHY